MLKEILTHESNRNRIIRHGIRHRSKKKKKKKKESTIAKVAVGMGLSYLWMEMTLNGSRTGWIAWKMEKGDCGVGMLIKK